MGSVEIKLEKQLALLRKYLANVVNGVLGLVGLRISRLRRDKSESLEVNFVLGRLGQLKIDIGTIIDIGASDGRWSRMALTHFQQSKCLLIEANPFHLAGLKRFANDFPGAKFERAAASDHVGEIGFFDDDPWGGVATHSANKGTAKVRATTIDHEIERNNLKGPFLVKLDTHGHELAILRGAARALLTTEILIIESYNFQLNDQCATFWELCQALSEHGFRPWDLIEPMHRKKDGALWQMDIVFLRSSRPEFSDICYE